MEGLEIHRLTPERLKDVRLLAKKSLGVNYSLDFLRHKYNTKTYCDIENICFLAYHNYAPVGFYGALPLVLQKGDKQILVAQTCDSYTIPELQGKGIHFLLAKTSYSIMKELNVKGVFAFHSDNTFNACKKLGWELSRHLHVIQIEVPVFFPWLKILNKYPFFHRISQKSTAKILRKFQSSSEMINVFSRDVHYAAQYSESYFTYKNAHRCCILEIEECKIWIKIKSVIYIGAMENLTNENVLPVISSLKLLARKLGTNKIIIELDPEHPSYAPLTKHFTSKQTYKIGYLCFDESFNFSDVRLNFAESDNFL